MCIYFICVPPSHTQKEALQVTSNTWRYVILLRGSSKKLESRIQWIGPQSRRIPKHLTCGKYKWRAKEAKELAGQMPGGSAVQGTGWSSTCEALRWSVFGLCEHQRVDHCDRSWMRDSHAGLEEASCHVLHSCSEMYLVLAWMGVGNVEKN